MSSEKTSPVSMDADSGVALAAQWLKGGRGADARTLVEKVLAAEPEHGGALHLLGLIHHLSGANAVALALLEKAQARIPENDEAAYNLGVVLSALGFKERAMQSYRRACALNPDSLSTRLNLGNMALEADLHEEAISMFDGLLVREPEYWHALLARAILHNEFGERDASEVLFARAAEVAAKSGDAIQIARTRWERSLHDLALKRYALGWDGYDARFASPNTSVWAYPYPHPLWRGEDLADKTILIHGEQGLGDEIMFASIFPDIVARAGKTVIACQPHLAGLFGHSFPNAVVVPQLRADGNAWVKAPFDLPAAAGNIDVQIPFGSLGALLRREAQAFPEHAGYLRATPARAMHWRNLLDEKLQAQSPSAKRLRVGVCWAANPALEDAWAARRSRKKSLSLAQLTPLFAMDCDFISLQTWEAARQVENAPAAVKARILDVSAGLTDFVETAALVNELDLVISVDTSVAHLAGALGKPVWLLCPRPADWRYGDQGEGCIWYPSMRVFRQREREVWEAPLAALCDALAEKVRGIQA